VATVNFCSSHKISFLSGKGLNILVIALYGRRTFFIFVFVYGRGKGIVGRIYRTKKII